jgi:Bax protein
LIYGTHQRATRDACVPLLGRMVYTVAIGLPLLGLFFLVLHFARPRPLGLLNPVPLRVIRARSVKEVDAFYRSLSYRWPPRGIVPAVALNRLPRGLGALGVHRKKSLFLRMILPMVLAADDALAKQRDFLLATYARPVPAPAGSRRYRTLRTIEHAYGLHGSPWSPAVRRRLLRRVDVVPVSLALAQAAKESGWGTSYFARRGNDLFGMWTYEAEHGLPPRSLEDPTHYVRRFRDLESSIVHYLEAINTRPAFHRFRVLRARLRAAGRPLTARALVAGLALYSQQGEAYVAAIRAMLLSLDARIRRVRLSLVPLRTLADLRAAAHRGAPLLPAPSTSGLPVVALERQTVPFFARRLGLLRPGHAAGLSPGQR